MTFTGHPTRPHAFGAGDGRIFIGDLRSSDPFDRVQLFLEGAVVDSNVFGIERRQRPDGPELVAHTGRRGIFAVSLDGTFESLDYRVPEDGLTCQTDRGPCGLIFPPTSLWEMASAPSGSGLLGLLTDSCSGLLLVDDHQGCAVTLSPAEHGYRPANAEDQLQAIEIQYGRLYAAGAQTLWRATLPAP